MIRMSTVVGSTCRAFAATRSTAQLRTIKALTAAQRVCWRSSTDRCASTSSSAPAKGGPGGAVGAPSDPNEWRQDEEKYWEMYELKGGRQPQKDFKVGPYAHRMEVDPKTGKVTPVAKFFVSPRKDPVTFVVNCLLTLTTIWTLSQLSWGESFFEKRKRVIRERIRQEYGLPKGWEHDIDDEDELILSDAAAPPGATAVGAAQSQ
eukprot:TRINITY_DN30784_c2_g1_i1.p1 TRINITY_DN30784_c2_g1~~TRINITY_DN30784_c2_g1_i1.p1  ORF type:complete len:205 (+),score=24.34 TRINITY_DN30784_c2_g1_i1:49-663(+)